MTRRADLSVVQAAESLDRFRLLDVREEHEFEGPLGRIAGSELIPLRDLALRGEQLGDDTPLLVVCRSGRRSASACETLSALDFDVTNLEGGMIAWNEADLPVERTPLESLEEILGSLSAYLAQVGGTSLPEAEESISRFAESHPSADGQRAGAVSDVLDDVVALLSKESPPEDLEIVRRAFRSDLSVL